MFCVSAEQFSRIGSKLPLPTQQITVDALTASHQPTSSVVIADFRNKIGTKRTWAFGNRSAGRNEDAVQLTNGSGYTHNRLNELNVRSRES
jgi:hypothetical protein